MQLGLKLGTEVAEGRLALKVQQSTIIQSLLRSPCRECRKIVECLSQNCAFWSIWTLLQVHNAVSSREIHLTKVFNQEYGILLHTVLSCATILNCGFVCVFLDCIMPVLASF